MEIKNFDKYLTYDEKNKGIKVAVAMSGGVDSSTVAYILKKQGYDIFGVTMRTCGPEDSDADKVCKDLGIEHYVFDATKEFKNKVMDYFIDEYKNGRTPNPCMVCNKHVKFGLLYDFALEKGAQFMATGHYAKIKDGALVMGDDLNKDQVYFLSQIKKENVDHIMFPIGDLVKPEVRELAKLLGVRVYAKRDSQEICFVEDGKLGEFLTAATNGKVSKPGNIVDVNGQILGKHKGLAFYTIGQRKGLGVSLEKPMYVIELDGKNNRVVIGDNELLFKKELKAKNINLFTIKSLQEMDGLECWAKTRSRDILHKCKIKVLDNDTIKVMFTEDKVRAVTPGQGVVFYDSDKKVIGSGFII
ncbi:tRNA 2-thiouridine(34) synthase MnmA [Fusobacterium hominis]|uniref:tRNA-specific 2-thiouridylase MnmA n=1 Tax=Fusobacterium hominis TaxID=2764326 RepID=A0A7G9GY11_9FUSO|nr:tRNA 2-thiouridine(34) synthase MnmA [Fusobacterium hominis]QNM15693.1 tRNA 2-thiouridine(34) synthase MnmA [Fusobacterium hominis]